jgi:prophage regulatory protein
MEREMTIKLIGYKDLKALKGIVYTTVHLRRKIKEGTFPKPVKVGANRIAFVEAEIDSWLAGLVSERDAA